MRHFALRVAQKRVNGKFPIQIAKPRNNYENIGKPRKPRKTDVKSYGPMRKSLLLKYNIITGVKSY